MKWVRAWAAALVAGALFGVSAAPGEAQAINFPVVINFSYCWGAVGPCAYPAGGYTPGATWQLKANGTFQDDQGGSGTYVIDAAAQTLTLTYPLYGTVYQGQHVGGGCFDGRMNSGAYSGTWAGCK